MTENVNSDFFRASRISERGIAFIKEFEGKGGKPVLAAFQDTGDPVTIGYGHTGKVKDPESGALRPLRIGDRITSEYAEELLREDLQMGEDRVDKYYPDVSLTQGQRDALVSFCFNMSLTGIIGSTLRAMINEFGPASIMKQTLIEWWIKYRNPKTGFEEGLFRRRLGEVCLWYDLDWPVIWQAELRRNREQNITFMTNPELIIMRAEDATRAARGELNTTAPEEAEIALPVVTPTAPSPKPPEPVRSSPMLEEAKPVAQPDTPKPPPTKVPPPAAKKKEQAADPEFWAMHMKLFGRVGLALGMIPAAMSDLILSAEFQVALIGLVSIYGAMFFQGWIKRKNDKDEAEEIEAEIARRAAEMAAEAIAKTERARRAKAGGVNADNTV